MTVQRPSTDAWSAARREAAFVARDRSVWAWWFIVLSLSMLAVWAGLTEVRHQQATIARLIDADRADRLDVLKAQKSWGSAAYYSFHLTFDPPSKFAYAALGRRDDMPWKHRVRTLALEGQIHERDAGHPVLALVGRFDFDFLAAFVLPLVLIVVLHDVRARERSAGRYDLLVATAGSATTIWHLRAAVRAGGVFACAAVPLVFCGLFAGAPVMTLLAACGALLLYVTFWTAICAAVSAWRQKGEVILTALLGLWILLGVLIPAGIRIGIDRAVPVPSGAQIMLTQREAVNDAWDLPKATTMDAFIQRHPQWAAHTVVERPFEWKWYYALQQVGDQKAEALSDAYTRGRVLRDQWASRLALLVPPVLLERTLQSLAGTDLQASLGYEARVRAFHTSLREFYYPKLFLDEPFEAAALEQLPAFEVRP